MDELENKPRATIRHKLAHPDKSLKEFPFVEWCLLRDIPIPKKALDCDFKTQQITKLYSLQKRYRSQLYRLIASDPANRLAYTYQLNCLPVGVLAYPKTKTCNESKLCPWCKVRRVIMPVRNALLAVPVDERSKFKLFGWTRLAPFSTDSKMLFFPPKTGPHQWCKAVVTTQTITPALHKTGDTYELMWQHTGIQRVPVDSDPIQTLEKHFKRASARFQFFQPNAAANLPPLFQMLAVAFRFNWLAFLAPEQFHLFQALNADFKRQRFVRINKYKGV
jgi:hypothetical protein